MNIYDSFDNDALNLFEAVAGAVEGIGQDAIQILATKGLLDVQYEDAGNMLEQAIGVGFVTAQAFLVERCGRRPVVSRKALYCQGPQLASGAYVAEVINDAANFWKHAPDWVGDNTDGFLAIKTRRAINALLGEDLSATPLYDILLLIDGSGRVGALSAHLRCWAKALHPIIENKLWGKE